MTLVKKIKDKKVNFEFNKEYIKVVNDKIQNNDASFITNSFSVLFRNSVLLSSIFLLKTLMNSLLNSKFTFLSFICFVKLINVIYLLIFQTI